MKALKAISWIALVGALAGGTACGKNSSSPTGPSNPIPAPVPAPVPSPAPAPQSPAGEPYTATYQATVGDYADASHRLVMPRDGAATFTLRWSNGSADLDLGLTPDSCVNFWADSCVHLADSVAVNGTTETIVRTVKTGEAYRLWVVSYAHAVQAYTLDVSIP